LTACTKDSCNPAAFHFFAVCDAPGLERWISVVM
jgi:hypothetical protein